MENMFGSVRFYPDLNNFFGGPASFQKRLEAGLGKRGIKVSYDYDGNLDDLDTVLLINATKSINKLLRIKRKGIRLVQRLGSPFPSNSHLQIGPLKRFRTWLGTQNVAFIRAHLADIIVYQSQFVLDCWEKKHGILNKPKVIIYNGVDLVKFSPRGPRYKQTSDVCIISVEGTQYGPEQSPAFLVALELKKRGFDVELLVFGRLCPNVVTHYSAYSFVKVMGSILNENLPYYYKGASFFVSNDVIAACPNSVIEALACGTPIVGYKFSVLPEIVNHEAGRCVPVVGNPWKNEPPGNVKALANAAQEVVENNSEFRNGARRLAEERYNCENMIDRYMEVFFQ